MCRPAGAGCNSASHDRRLCCSSSDLLSTCAAVVGGGCTSVDLNHNSFGSTSSLFVVNILPPEECNLFIWVIIIICCRHPPSRGVKFACCPWYTTSTTRAERNILHVPYSDQHCAVARPRPAAASCLELPQFKPSSIYFIKITNPRQPKAAK